MRLNPQLAMIVEDHRRECGCQGKKHQLRMNAVTKVWRYVPKREIGSP